jgi:hypothetical protein
MINAYGNQNKVNEIYRNYKIDIKNLIQSYEIFLKTNQLYWYKDNYYQNQSKLQDFKRYYNKLSNLYGKSNFKRLREWLNMFNSSSFL